MAAVMVGGMVPPIAIALSTTFCPKKWSPDERRNGIVNYVMGLCFVTEGAIPYAAADPLRVLPSCIIGSALAGSLSMVFGCALRAPHGGIFVFPVVDHALLYVVALIVGSVVGAVILSLLKKEYVEEEIRKRYKAAPVRWGRPFWAMVSRRGRACPARSRAFAPTL